MIDFLSIRLADFLCRKEIINEEDKELYVYGYQLLISSCIGILITLTIGIIVGKLPVTILFLVIFVSTRQRCGGFHANHFITCILSFATTYVSIVVLEDFLVNSDYLLCCILMEVAYFITIMKFAPIEHKNKPLSKEVKRDNRMKSIQYSVFWIVISIPSFIFLPEMGIMIALTLAAIAMFMLLEIVLKEVKENEA